MPQSSYDYKWPNRIARTMQRYGWAKGKNLVWSWYEPRNFGDWIGPYLYEHISGENAQFSPPMVRAVQPSFYAAGSVLRHIKTPDLATVWGSGIISETDDFARPKAVTAVRGPRTAAYLRKRNYPSTDVYGDPGILLPEFFMPTERKTAGKIGIIPHFVDLDGMRGSIGDDVVLIDVTKDVENVVAQIAACEATVSSSLHGIILSHAYGVPCAWINRADRADGDGVKYHDYFEAGGVFDAKAYTLGDKITASALRKMAMSAPMPDIPALVQPLLNACPFPKKAA